MTSRSNREHPLLAAAIRYAARGWRVFPLGPRDKKPLTRTGFKEATSDHGQVLQWWQVFPEANIGLATGDPFDVLDIDGPSSVPALQELLGTDYRHTGPVANTGRGKHLYFLSMQEGRNRAGLLGGKLDYRGAGGYVVAPPSVHPSGRTYRWDGDRDEDTPLPVVPENLQDIVVGTRATAPSYVAVAKGGLYRTDKAVELTQRGKYIGERPPIVEVCQAMGLIVSRMGIHHVTNCIFHPDPSPSMVLYTEQDKFHCFGCEAHGDSYDLRERRDMTGRTAII